MNKQIFIPIQIVFLIWIIFFVENILSLDLGYLGILPRTLHGVIGIITAPLIHANFAHLLSNTAPFLILGIALFVFYPTIGLRVLFSSWIFTGVLVWSASPRLNYHIGMSGVIFSLASFLISYGFFRKNVLSLVVSIVVFLMYGGIFYGVLPTDPTISWESHLAGAIVGFFTAYNINKEN